MSQSRYSSLSPANNHRRSANNSSQSPKFVKSVLPVVKKKAVFREYTQSRNNLDLTVGQINTNNRLVMPLTTKNSKRGGSMYLTEAEVKIEEDSDRASTRKESLYNLRIKKQAMRHMKRSKQFRNQAASLLRRSQQVSDSLTGG